MSRTITPNQQFFVDGKPNAGGYLYYGVPNQDPKLNPLTIFSDEDLTDPIQNPQRIDDQGFSEKSVYLAESQYSFLVEDINNNQVYLEPELEALNVQGLVTADIDMNGFKHTNVADAVLANQYATLGQLNASSIAVVDTDGTSTPDALVVVLPVAPASLVDGLTIIVNMKVGSNTVTNPTLKVGAFAAKFIYRDLNANLVVGDTGGTDYHCIFVYDSSLDKFQLLNTFLSLNYAPQSIGNASMAENSISIFNMQNNSVDSPELVSGSVGQSEIDSSAVGRSEMKTATDQDSLSVTCTSNVGVSFDRVSLDGSDMSFFPRTQIIVNSGTDGQAWFGLAAASSSNDNLSNNISLMGSQVGTGGGTNGRNYTGSVFNTYVASSPPYNVGHGDMAMIPYLRINKAGEITGAAMRSAPAWIYHGKTNITADRMSKILSPCGKKVIGVRKYKNVPVKDYLPPWEGGDLDEWLNPEMVEVEIDQEMKNRDMHENPHPFLDVKEDEQILMVDPCSSFVDNLAIMKAREINLCELFINKDIILGDEIKGFKNPHGVKVVSATWKNKLKKRG